MTCALNISLELHTHTHTYTCRVYNKHKKWLILKDSTNGWLKLDRVDGTETLLMVAKDP